MNSHLRSIGKVFLVVSVVAHVSGCASSDKARNNRVDLPPPGEEVSLKADRSALDELRKDIPEDVKKENDESALILNLMTGDKTEPSTVREKWNDMVRKRRDAFEKWSRKTRDTFNDTETKNREKFMDQQTKARESFSVAKHTSDERKTFYDDSDQARRDYFSDQRDRREEFESIIREKRTTFDSEIRDQQSQFDQEYRNYSRRFQDARQDREREAKAKELERERKEQAEADARERRAIEPRESATGLGAPAASPALSPAQQSQRSQDAGDFQRMPHEHAIPLSTSDGD